ncbi:MAG: TIGR02466 family protein [Pseudomonadota bacterium]
MRSHTLFPTRIQETEIGDPSLVSDLEAAIWMLEDGDDAGHRWCETHGYDGYTSYASLNDLPTRASAFETLSGTLAADADAFAETLGWDMDGRCLVLDSLWVNILGEGGSHSGHIHPNSVISGTVYVSVPQGAGAIRFEDPRLAMLQAAPPMRVDADESQKRFVHITPKAGRVLMWESWLRHEVMPNRAETPRLSISFNFALDAAD